MKQDKKQTQQLIVLGALLVVCVCFVAFQLKPGSAPPAPLKTPKADAVTKDASVKKTDAAGELVAKAVFPALDSTVARRDPFQPAKLPVDPTDVIPADFDRPKPASAGGRPTVSVKAMGSLPQVKVNPINPFKIMGSETPKPAVVVEEEKDPEFALTGVVQGTQNVAIIRVGDSGRYVVKQGQYVEGRYRVVSVTNDSATLLYKGRRIHIKLGGVNNAS